MQIDTSRQILLSSEINFIQRLDSQKYCHTRLHLGYSAKLGIWQVPACKMEPRRGIILMKPPTHPPTHPPRRTSFFATCRPLIKKLLLQNVTNYYQGVQNWFSKQEMELSKQEMELSKQEMELFLSLPCFWSKNFFYNIFSIFTNEFKIGFQNRKWNYPNRKWNYPNRKLNYFTNFRTSNQTTYFTKCLSF